MDEISRQPGPGTELATQACISCRKQKRKCDKKLPACTLCQRIGRICDYTADTQPHAPSSEEFAALRQQVTDLQNLITSNKPATPFKESNGNSSYSNDTGSINIGIDSSRPADVLSGGTQPIWPGPSSFPSLFFLDSQMFEYERFQIQAPYVKVPPGALTVLGNSIELREMIENYFRTVHNYFPVVSKIRLYQHLANPLHEPGADIALLFLAMKLICSDVPEGMPSQTQLYQDVKSFHHYVEAQNGFSVQMIQALLLIALYELGHAIYPATYLSIGNAARLGHAAGLHDRKAPQMLPRCTTWTEQEERRRLWWGVVVLDRFINIGHRGKPFASADPSLDTHLPTDDAAWDRGQMLAAAPLSLSASQAIRVSPYARTCQSAHLLGKILHHMDDKGLSSAFTFSEALQLHRTTRALADVLPDEAQEASGENLDLRPSLCTSMAIAYSGLLTLYDSYSCTAKVIVSGDEKQLVMQKESIEGLSEISDRAVQLSRRVRDVVTGGQLDRLSPMVIDCVYQAAANYAWYVRESSDPTCGERLLELKELLAILDRRWKVAGEYLRIVESTEFNLSTAYQASNPQMY